MCSHSGTLAVVRPHRFRVSGDQPLIRRAVLLAATPDEYKPPTGFEKTVLRYLRIDVTIGFFVSALCLCSPAAQKPNKCKLLCTPKLKLEPTLTIENLFNPPRIAELENGVPVRTAKAEWETAFEMVLALDIPTEIPRVGLTFETIWVPFTGTPENPFTNVTAQELGIAEIRDNSVELEFELNLTLLEAEQSGGWVETHIDIVDKFSPAERPGDTAAYTQKLNLELEGSLDYVATGIPRAGDILGNELFIDDASPWSFSIDPSKALPSVGAVMLNCLARCPTRPRYIVAFLHSARDFGKWTNENRSG